MAVQQNKKSPSRRGMRRSHHCMRGGELSVEPTTGDRHRRHHISDSGYYRGRRVVGKKIEAAPEETR